MTPPVLFLFFNRPDTTLRVFDRIREARPSHLFLACDGARKGKLGEAEAVAALRARVLESVDWPCEVHQRFLDTNHGCKKAVSGAITWFFENVEEGVVLEDDCLPAATFFEYAAEMLRTYRDDPRVMCVSGDRFAPVDPGAPESYGFSKYVHIWGWATWRRAWALYEPDISSSWKTEGETVIERTFPDDVDQRWFWREAMSRSAAGGIDTWDYQWVFCCWRHEGLSCVPATNLVSNIGFGSGATHTADSNSPDANRPVTDLVFPLVHPAEVRADRASDAWEARNVFGVPVPGVARNLARAVRRWVRLGRERLGM